MSEFTIEDIPKLAPESPESLATPVTGIPQSTANPLLDTFGAPEWEQADQEHQAALGKWYRDGTDSLDAAVLDPETAFKGMDLGFSADREAAQRSVVNDSWLELHQEEPIAPDELQRRMQIQATSLARFGEMVDSDEALFPLIQKDAQRRKDGKALARDLTVAAFDDAMLPSDKAPGFTAFREKLKAHAGYRQENEADYVEAWHETRRAAAEKVDEFREPLVQVWRAFKTDGNVTAAAYDAYSKLTPEQRPQFMDALAIRARALPDEERATFWANMGQQTGQAVSDYGRNAAESVKANTFVALPGMPGLLQPPGAIDDGNAYREQQEQMRRGKEDFQQARNFAADVRKVAREDYDPLKSAFGDGEGKPGFWEGVAYQAPGVTVTSLSMAVPVVGVATMAFAMEGQAYETLRGRMLASGLDDATATANAEVLAPFVALPQAALEKVGFGIWSRKLPGFSKVMDTLGDKIANRALRGGAKTLTIGTAETGIELIQDMTNYAVQDIAAALTEDVPDVDWSKELSGTWAQAPEIFATMLPLAILGAAGGLNAESQQAAFSRSSQTELEAFGINPEGIAAIQGAQGPASLASAIESAMETRDPNSETAQAAVGALKLQLETQRRAQQNLEKLGYAAPSFVQSPEGITVFDGDGQELGSAPDLSGAVRIARAHTVALDDMEADQVAALGSLMEAAKAAVELDPSSTLDVNLGAFDPETASPEMAARFAAQVALKEQAEGGTGDIARSVLGYSVTEMAQGVRQTVNRIFRGAAVTDVFHETFHGLRRQARAAGTITRTDELAMLRALDTVLAGKVTKDGTQLRFIPENMTDDQVSETLLDEAFSEIAEMEILRTRKKDGKGKLGLTRGVISRNLSALTKLIPGVAGKWTAFMQAVRARWGLSLSRAIAMKKAERDGTFDKQGYDAYLDKILGLDQQTEHDAGVQSELDRILGMPEEIADDDIPFSIGKAADAEYLSLAQDPEKNQERLTELVTAAMAAKGYSQDDAHKLMHQAPNASQASEDGSSGVVSLANLKNSELVPADYWTRPDWYLSTGTERESHGQIKRAMEGAKIRVYRSIPATAKDEKIRNGDWVTPSRAYAVESGYDENAPVKVISTMAKADQLFWDGNSADELGFDDGKNYAYKNTKNNRKLADLVTYDYDEDGNRSIVPLSKRFNYRDASPAFSIGPKLLKMKPPKGVTANTTESLPTWTIPQEKGVSLPKVLSTPKSRAVFYKRLDGALKWLNENPARIITASGWVKFLQKAGVWGEVPMPPMGLAEIINDPAAYVAKLNGGYHGEATLPGTQESARQGLDGTKGMRDLIGEGQAPAPFVVALHHMWGILSRMLPPLHQEGMWLRLISHRPVLDAIQASLDGKFSMGLEEWQGLVQGARDTTAEGAGQIGNAATANANSFFMMLERLNGRWQDMADVYSAPTSREMGRRFWDIDSGALGIKNKVQRFIGLTFGIPGVIMDRWKFVEFWLPTAMEGKGKETPADYFTYGNNVPSDPAGIYGVYGSVDSGNEALSLAMYEAFETVLEAAIAKSPELQAHLGDHANPGGMHWHGWNAIKNEAVGHSSLDLTKELIASFGVAVTAENVHNAIRNGTYYTEGAETQQSNVKFFLEGGKVRVERTSVASGLQPGRAGILGRGDGAGAATGSGGVQGAAGQVESAFSIGRSTVTPTASTRSFQGAEGSPSVIGPAAFSIGAWHGTPHKVDPKEGLKLDRIGTGEGAQAFGWGLYLADMAEVSEGYMKAGRNLGIIKDSDGKWWTTDGPQSIAGPFETSVEAEAVMQEKSGNLYRVNFKVEEKDLLDWDEPIMKQSKTLQKIAKKLFNARLPDAPDYGIITAALKAGGYGADEIALVIDNDRQLYTAADKATAGRDDDATPGEALVAKWKGWVDLHTMDGKRLYESLSESGIDVDDRRGLSEKQRKISEMLLAADIRGIRYLDGNSRADGEGSYNYVVFDEADIEIVEENGTPVNLSESPNGSFSIGPNQSLLQPLIQGNGMDAESEVSREGSFRTFAADYATSSGRLYRFAKVDDDDQIISALEVKMKGPRSKSGVIVAAYTADEHRRKGHAGSLLRYAQKNFEVKHSTDLTNDGRAFKKADGVSYSIGPAKVADIMAGNALKRITDPRRRTQVMSRIARDFGNMRLQIERMASLSGIRRSKGDLRREAMAREDLRAEELIADVHRRFGDLLADDDLVKIKSQPVHAALADPATPLRGRLKSKAAAIKDHPDMFQLHRAGDYDGSDGVSRSVFGGQRMPDQAAQELYDDGLIPEPTADALWEALLSEQKTVKGMKDLLVIATTEIREAKAQAKQEANEWLATQGKDQEVNFSDKEEIRRSLRMLDAILLALPAEIRGKIGGYTQISMIGTDEAKLAFLKDKLVKADKELETFLRVEYAAEWESLLKKAAPATNEAGQRPTGSIAADAYDIFRVAEAAMGMNFAQGEAEADKWDAIADHPDTEPKDVDMARVKAQMIRLTMNWHAADAARREQAVLEGEKIYYNGLLALKVEASRRRERLGKLRDSAVKGTGKTGHRMEREAAKQATATKLGAVKAMAWEFLSFGQVVNVLFGEKSAAALWFNSKEIAASNAAHDGFQAKANALESLFDTLSGNRFDGEKLRHRMATAATIKVKDVLGVDHTFTESQAITFLLMYRQEDGKRHLQGLMDDDGNILSEWAWDDKGAATLEAGLSPEGRAAMAFLGSSYGEEYGRINDVFRRIWNVSMPRHKMYAPLSVKPVQGKGDTIMDPVSGDAMGAGMTPGSLKNRSFSAIAEPDFKDAFQVYLTHARQMEHFIAYAEFSRDALAVVNRRETRNAIEAAGGADAAGTLSKWIDYFALGGVHGAAMGGAWTKILGGMLGRLSQAALVGRVSVLCMQSLQLAAASFKMPTGAFLTRFAKLSAGRLAWGDTIQSEYIQRRMQQLPPVVRDMMAGMASGTPNRAKHLAGQAGRTIAGADALFTAGTYAIFYDYHLGLAKKAGITNPEAHAHAEAERFTDQVAQPTRTGARSWLEVANAGNPAFRAAWNFSSDPRQKMSLLVYAAMRKDTTGKEKKADVAFTAAKLWIIGGVMQTLMRTVLRDLRNDDDDEIFDERYWSPARLALQVATGPLGAVPFLGGMMEDATYKATGQFAPQGGMLSFLDQAAGLPKKWAGGKVEPIKDAETLTTAGAGFSGTSAAAASAMHIIRDVVGFIENLEGPD